MSEIERVVEKAKQEEEVEKFTPADILLQYFNKADEILKTDFVWLKEQEKTELENFKKEYEINTLYYVKILETHRPDLLVDEPDNTQDDRQNLIRNNLFNKDLGDDIILPEADIDNVKTEDFIPDIRPPAETGIESVDDKN